MLILLSPSKTMAQEPSVPEPLSEALKAEVLSRTQPCLSAQSHAVIRALKAELRLGEPVAFERVGALMGVSERLARTVLAELESWRPEGTQLALLSYSGDVFQGLDPSSWSAELWSRAQAQLRVLSGLYGAARPLDMICRYRLEMGLVARGALLDALRAALLSEGAPPAQAEGARASLAQLWRPRLSDELKRQLDAEPSVSPQAWALNLASLEYSQALDFEHLELKPCAPRFLDLGPKGDYKVVSRYAKRARGLMARYALSIGASSPQELTHFNWEGYEFVEAESRVEEGALVFKRAALPSA